MDCFDLSTSPLQALWQGWHWWELENNLWILCLTRLAWCFCPAKGLAPGCQSCCVPRSPFMRMPVSVLALYKCGRQTMVEGVPLPAYAKVLHLWCAFFMTSGQRRSATELQFSSLWNGSLTWAALKLAKCYVTTSMESVLSLKLLSDPQAAGPRFSFWNLPWPLHTQPLGTQLVSSF